MRTYLGFLQESLYNSSVCTTTTTTTEPCVTSSILLFSIGDSRIRQRLERIAGTEFFPLLFPVTLAIDAQQRRRSCVSSAAALVSLLCDWPHCLGAPDRGSEFLPLHSSTLRKEKKKASPRLTTLAPRHYILWREEKEAEEESNAALTLTSQACATQTHTHKQLKASGEKQEWGGGIWWPPLSPSRDLLLIMKVACASRTHSPKFCFRMCLVLVVKATRLMPRELTWRRGFCFRIISAHALHFTRNINYWNVQIG